MKHFSTISYQAQKRTEDKMKHIKHPDSVKKHDKHRTPEEVKIFRPKADVISAYQTNPMSDYYISDDGCIYNKSDENIVMGKEWVEENEK